MAVKWRDKCHSILFSKRLDKMKRFDTIKFDKTSK